MLAKNLIFAACATLAVAVPSEKRASQPAGWAYGVSGTPVACAGVSIPSNGLYAAILPTNPFGAVCGSLLTITDTANSKTVTDVLVTATFPVVCDSIACASNAVQISAGVASALGTTVAGAASFPASWGVQA